MSTTLGGADPAEPPAAPVQPEERREPRVFAQEPGSDTGEYGTLLSQAARFADQLRDRGVGPDWFAGYGEVFRLAIAGIDTARAALATAERERDALRLFRVEVAAALDWSDGESDETLLDSLRKNLRLRDAHTQTVNRLAAALAEVAEIADNLDKAEVGSVMTYGDARGIAATLRAALGSTPDTTGGQHGGV